MGSVIRPKEQESGENRVMKKLGNFHCFSFIIRATERVGWAIQVARM